MLMQLLKLAVSKINKKYGLGFFSFFLHHNYVSFFCSLSFHLYSVFSEKNSQRSVLLFFLLCFSSLLLSFLSAFSTFSSSAIIVHKLN